MFRQAVTNDFKILGGERVEQEKEEERSEVNLSLFGSSYNYQKLHSISNVTPHPHPTTKSESHPSGQIDKTTSFSKLQQSFNSLKLPKKNHVFVLLFFGKRRQIKFNKMILRTVVRKKKITKEFLPNQASTGPSTCCDRNHTDPGAPPKNVSKDKEGFSINNSSKPRRA